MVNYLTYNTPINQMNYAGNSLPFASGTKITTLLPKNIALTRAITALALALFAAFRLSATLLFWPTIVVASAFIGRTIYSHLIIKDPLVEAFYKIVGGKDKYEKLPEISLQLAPDDKVVEAIQKIYWDQLLHPMTRSKTLDGRHVIIVKGLGENQTQGVLTFVEKMGPYDISRVISNEPEWLSTILEALLSPLEGNRYQCFIDSSTFSGWSGTKNSRREMYSTISSDMANEFAFQLK